MKTIDILLLINYILDVLIVLNMIFITKKKPERITAWTIFLLVPFVGIFFYILIGGGLNIFTKNMIKKVQLSSSKYDEQIKKQIQTLTQNDEPKSYPVESKDLILLNLNNADSIFTKENSVEFFYDGETTVQKMIDDIKEAKSTIHLEFYIFANDKIGKSIIKLLTEKAKQGVEVRVMYDAIGSIHTSKFNFRKLRKAGGMVTSFFPPFLNIKLLNLKANYRNHRKICTIDGKIGYVGGFNIREDHLGHVKRLAPWRDTTMRIMGKAVSYIQSIFLSDWRFASKDLSKPEKYIVEKYFPKAESKGMTSMQVISSGPYDSNEAIKECMIKMIVSAKKSVKIQTPYFIPDDTFIGAVKLALLSGVNVELMVPKKIDHYHVHFASFSYINDLLKFGLKVYVYDGFIHSKVVVADDEVMTAGSCNIDIRSFSLNFEDNVVLYDKNLCISYSQYFEKDKESCKLYDEESRKKRNIFAKFFTDLFRLFSAIL